MQGKLTQTMLEALAQAAVSTGTSFYSIDGRLSLTREKNLKSYALSAYCTAFNNLHFILRFEITCIWSLVLVYMSSNQQLFVA